jgi:hypothetical protein
MIYTDVLNRGGKGVKSPADALQAEPAGRYAADPLPIGVDEETLYRQG